MSATILIALSRRLVRIGAWSAGILATLVAAAFILLSVFAGRAEDQQSTLARLISQLLSSKGSQVSIGNIEGPLSSNAAIRNLSIADKNGVWLKVDRVTLVWSRLGLLRRRLEVDTLDIGKLEILRKPVSDAAAAPPQPAANQSILPELPLKVIVKAFKLQELALGADVAGLAARLSANGALTLGPPSEGLDAKLEIDRIDSADAARIKLLFVPKGEKLTLDISYKEAAGGLLSHAAGIPGHPPVNLTLKGDGPLDKFAASLDFAAGATIGARGSVDVVRRGAMRQLQLDLTSRIEGLLGPLVGPVFAGDTKLVGNADFRDDGAIDLEGLKLTSRLAQLNVAGGARAGQEFQCQAERRRAAKRGRPHTARRGQHWQIIARRECPGHL